MIKKTVKYLILLSFIGVSGLSYSQQRLDGIEFERIPQRTVRKYIARQIEEGKYHFNDIHPSWTKGQDLSSFREKVMTFFLDGNLQDIWQGYTSANPTLSWNGRTISFGVLLWKYPGQAFYDHDQIMGVDTGQVYYLNLNLLMGVFNLPVAFEMITVNPIEKVIEFSYIDGNKSVGVQQVRFIGFGEEQTEIIHTSYYKSGSYIRDKLMYPYFHKRIVRDFHHNMQKLLKINCTGM